MITLSLGNSYSQITGLTSVQAGKLRKVLSYDPQPEAARYVRGGYRPKLRYLIDAKGFFPTGLLLDVGCWLYDEALEFETKDTRAIIVQKNTPMVTGGRDPYKAQKQAVFAAVTNHRGILSIPTGVGKSHVVAMLMSQITTKCLIVVPTVELKRQLSESLRAAFPKDNNWRVENIDSTALKGLKDFDMIIWDEVHHGAASQYQKLNKTNWGGIYYRFGMTATPYRTNDNEQILFRALAGEIIYQLSYKDAIANGYIVPVEAYFYEVPPKETTKTVWTGVYSDLVVNNDARNEMLALLLLRLNASGKSVLCLVKEIAHGKALEDLTGLYFMNGQDVESREHLPKFNQQQIKALIGTTGVIGEGIDSKPCEYVVIACLGKSKSAFLQQVGRAIRTYPGKETAKVILFYDRSHKWTVSHFKAQCVILKEEFGIVPVKLTLE